MSKVVAVRLGINDKIEKFKLDDGRVLNYSEAIQVEQSEDIDNLIAQRSPLVGTILRTPPTDTEADNLGNLPRF